MAKGNAHFASPDSRSGDLQKVLEITRAMSATVHLNSLLDLIIRRSVELLNAERATLFLYDAAAGELVSCVITGMEQLRISANQGIAGWVARNGTTLNIADAYADNRFNQDVDRATGFRTNNLLALPLRDFQSQLVGVLEILNSKAGAFSDYDVWLGETLAAQAGVAIERARLIDQYVEKQKLEKAHRELIELEKTVEEKNRELTKLNEQKNEFLGIAAHDLRNPLSAIMGFSDLLLSSEGKLSTEDKKKILTIMCDSSRFMYRLVSDLLDVAKIEAGKLQLDKKQVDLVELIGRNIAVNAVIASKKEIGIGFTNDVGDKTVMATVDPAKIEQVLHNLISNGIKYSLSGTMINVSLDVDCDDYVISVADQGQGIPADELDKLFLPFQTTRVAPTAGEKSTGLGLAISKKIVEGHGGKIWVKSAPGEGTMFSFSLSGVSAG